MRSVKFYQDRIFKKEAFSLEKKAITPQRKVQQWVLPIRASPFFTPELSRDDKSNGRSKRTLAAILETQQLTVLAPGISLLSEMMQWRGHQECGCRMADLGCVPSFWGGLDQDQWSKICLDHCASKEPVNPPWSWIHRWQNVFVLFLVFGFWFCFCFFVCFFFFGADALRPCLRGMVRFG